MFLLSYVPSYPKYKAILDENDYSKFCLGIVIRRLVLLRTLDHKINICFNLQHLTLDISLLQRVWCQG